MASRNYYRRTDRQQNPKLTNVIAIPSGIDVCAVYSEQDGREVKSPVLLIGVYDNGDLHFLEMSMDGSFDIPEEAVNFSRYEFRKK